MKIHSVPLVAVFACKSFGNHNVPLMAMPRLLPARCGNSQCAACGSAKLFACRSFGKHNVPLVAVPSFLPAGVLVSNHCVPLVAMPRFLPAGCGNLQCAACGSFCLPEFW